MTGMRVLDESMDWQATGATLEWDGESARLVIPGISLQARALAIEEISRRIDSGSSLQDALSLDLPHRAPVGETLREDIILVDASEVSQAPDAVDIAKSVSALARGSRRVVAVAGALDFTGSSDYDNLSAFGALMVRLNVTQVFAVGQSARALFLSVGMEGSWDGESRFCQDTSSAYDDIRAKILPGDVLLVLGSTDVSLGPLVTKLREALA